MKKILLSFAAIALLVSCSKDDEGNGNGMINSDAEIEMTVDFTEQTRAVTSFDAESFLTHLQKHDLLGVSLHHTDSAGNVVFDRFNQKYKVSEKGRVISLGKPVTFPKAEGYCLSAYFPYDENLSKNADMSKFTVRTDQSKCEDFELSHFMTFYEIITRNTPPSIKLKFVSRVALASVELDPTVFTNVESVYIHAFTTGSVKYDQEGKPVYYTEGVKKAVKMFNMEGTLYTAYVPAQAIDTIAPLYTIKHFDGTTEDIYTKETMLMDVAEVSELLIGKNHNLVAKGKKNNGAYCKNNNGNNGNGNGNGKNNGNGNGNGNGKNK